MEISCSCFFVYTIVVSLGLEGSIAGGGRTLQEVRRHSPHFSDLFKRVNYKSENFIYLGVFPLLLTLFSFLFCFAKGRLEEKRTYNSKIIILFYLLTFLVAIFLSPGPNLCWRYSLYRVACKFIPYFKYPRASGRIIVFGYLSLSILAGFGLMWIQNLRLGKRIKFTIFTILLLGILIDYSPARPVGISLLPQKKNEVYSLIKKDIGSQRLLELPIWPGDSSWSSLYLYYITKTHAKVINGYSATVSKKYVKDIFIPLYYLDFGEMRKEEYSLLKELNVKYIIFHAEAYPYKVSSYPPSFAVENLKNSRYIELVKQEDPLWLFRLLDTPGQSQEQVFSQSSVMGTLYEAERLPHRGQLKRGDIGSSGEGAVFGDISEDDIKHLVFGPYRTFPTGRYKAIFRLKVDNNLSPEKVAKIDVSTDKGKKVIEEMIVYSKGFNSPKAYQDFVVPFELKKPERLEFRVRFYKNVNLWVDYIYVIFGDQKDPSASFEAEDFFHIGPEVFDPKAREERAIHAGICPDKKDTTRDYLNSGPNRIYPEGRYRVYFRLKTDSLTEDEAARIEVVTNRRKKELASRMIKGTDFKEAGEYNEFVLAFELNEQRVLEFLVFFSGNAHLWFDSVRVEKA